ncbi:MAG: glycosyltransferase family 4 protein [Patescibacteria group bacterium]|nr:glycosyltransferase family 4 protein [Patescibacteria group bacterium]
MKVGIVLDVLNEHSGARAGIKLGEYLGREPGTEVFFFASEKLLDTELLEYLKSHFSVFIFSKPSVFSFKLCYQLRKSGVEIISAHCSLRILISAFLSGVPVVRTDYGTQFPSLNDNYDSWRIGLLERIFNLAADVYVYIRDSLKFLFAKETLSISLDSSRKSRLYFGRSTRVIYLGYNGLPKPYDHGGNSFRDDRVQIISVSRFVPYKGFHILVGMFKELQASNLPVDLVLVGGQGGGRYFDFLKKLIDLDKHIKLIFNPDDKELVSCYQSSDIYANCTRWEALGLPFLEASSFGLPTVGFSYFGPANEVIKDGETGFVVENRDQFKENMRRLIVDRELRRSIGEAGKIFSRRFSWDSSAKEYRKVFEEIIGV